MKTALIIIVTKILLYKAQAQSGWNYDDQNAWCEISDMCCGEYQSPIRLWDSDRKTWMAPFKFIDYSKLPKTVSMENDGHTVILTFTGITPKISGGGLKGKYKLDSFHFHWGVNNHQGSEHTLNGRQAPLELHMVHYKCKFENVTEAIASGESDALAVLGVLYWIDDHENNPSLKQITSRLQHVKFRNEHTEVKPFNLRKLLPSSTRHFFRYRGSLTTPNCNEVVAWTVFRESGFVTNSQMKAFRSTYSTERDETPRKTIADNYRFVQALNRRTVYHGVESYDYYNNYF